MTAKASEKKTTVAERLEETAIRAIAEKARSGKALSRSEVVRLGRYESQKREREWRDGARSLQQQTIVDIYDTSRKIVREWEVAGMPRNADKSYDLFLVARWLKVRWLRGDDGDDDERSVSPQLERQRKARAELLELELAERRGEVISVAEVKHESFRAGEIFRRRLLAMPNVLAPRLEMMSAPEVSEILAQEVEETFNVLRGDLDRAIGVTKKENDVAE